MTNRTFKPIIKEGVVLAGGMKIAELREMTLVFEDRWQDRCRARGTEDVPVELWALVEELIHYYQGT
jgi:hypothetical protein